VVELMQHESFINDWITPRLQDPLLAARAAAKAGQRVIGYVGAEIPVELIVAANALPVRLRGKPNASTNHADKYLESAFLPETRAIAEQWLSGELDFIDAVIFPRSSDSSQRLYYYLCELQRRKHCKGPTPLLYDLATIKRDTSLDHTIDSTRRLATLLGVETVQLPRALQRVAQRTERLTRLHSLREHNPNLAGSTAFDVARAAEFDWSTSFDQALGTWLNSAQLRPSEARVLLAGSAPPDARLHLAVEAANGSIVSELVEATHSPSDKINGEEILAAIGQRHYAAVSPAQQMLSSPDWIASQAQKAKAQGVIIWLIEEDEALPWELASQTRALHDAKIPVLTLARQRWLAEAETLTSITSFVRSLELSR
jgi:benzoyl-CoA reductase/2-hydroxyglutaryl-CoA dehydratase subunit BcrC/BadD/HgdB